MHGNIFMATTGGGLARACQTPAGKYEVEEVLSGTAVTCLAVDPLNPERVYAGTDQHGVLRSDDRGATWRPAGLAGHPVKAVAPSPIEGDVVYAGTRPACLFVTEDGGAHWEELTSFRRIRWRWVWFSPAEKPFVAYVQGIALSPVDPARMVVGIEFGATVLSSDGGKSWSGHRRGALRDCHSLIFNPVDGGWVYEAGGTGGGAAYSRDGGRTWTNAGAGLDRHYGWAVAAEPSDPSVWYVSVAPGPSDAHGERDAKAHIYRRDGPEWRRLGGGLPEPLPHMPYALVAGREHDHNLYAGLSSGDLWRSPDRGENWEQLPVRLHAIRRSLVIL